MEFKLPGKDKDIIQDSLDNLLDIELENEFDDSLSRKSSIGAGVCIFLIGLSIFDMQSFIYVTKVIIWVAFLVGVSIYLNANKKMKDRNKLHFLYYNKLKSKGYIPSIDMIDWSHKRRRLSENPRNRARLSLVKSDGSKEEIHLNPYDEKSYSSDLGGRDF